MTRIAAWVAAIFFVLHGAAHAVGAKGILGGTENQSSFLGGMEPSSAAFRVLGLVWIAALVLFLVAAVALVLRRAWWWIAAETAAVFSLGPCILWADTAKVGLVINTVIIVGVTAWAAAGRGRVRDAVHA
jgi:hypothetical protein